MKNWTVTYSRSAQDELADVWLNAPDKQAVTQAANELDRLIRIDPMSAGEARAGGTRIAIQRPLAMEFDVLPDDRLVNVLAIRHWRQRKP